MKDLSNIDSPVRLVPGEDSVALGSIDSDRFDVSLGNITHINNTHAGP